MISSMRVARLGQRRRDGLDPDRAAAVVERDGREIAPVHRVEAGGIDFEREQRLVGDLAIDRGRASRHARNRARACNSRPAMRGVPRARRAISSAPSAVTAMPSTRAPRLTISSSSSRGVEIEPHRNAEAVAQRRGEQAGARRRADQREAPRDRSSPSAPPGPRR